MIAGYYWKLTLTRQFEWMTGPDLAEQVLPWFQVQAREWHAGRLPLWDPYLWAGQPLLARRSPAPRIRSTGSSFSCRSKTGTSRVGRWPGITW